MLNWFKKNRPIIVLKKTIDSDAQKLTDYFYQNGRADGVKSGVDIGILKVLRYSKENLSDAKFNQFAKEFNFDELNQKYPINPILEKT